MNNNEPQYETMPEHYLLCFNDGCPLADTCLHRLAARSGRVKDEVVKVVNPVRYCGENCPCYKENKVVTMAYGMKDSFHEVKADHIARLRNTLIDHFGRGSYYLRRNGLRAMTPDEQEYIGSVFRKFGYEVKFDRTAEETQWL
ncbi:MAG: hypothetical protein J5805_07815 [Bacteroidaceae bacterium]|nr:hypothetical protein [Bacteroidaceae bacterium]